MRDTLQYHGEEPDDEFLERHVSDSQRILSTCDICGHIARPQPVRISDLRQGSQRACGLCQVVSRSIDAWSQSLEREAREAFQKLNVLIFDQSNATDAHFFFQLNSGSNSELIHVGPRFQIVRDFLAEVEPTPALRSFLPRDVPTILDLSRVLSLVKQWFGSCDRYHARCSIAPNAQLPKRILDISSREDGTIKLKELSGTHAPYIALSYCWGSSNTGLRTTLATLAQHLRGIPLERFPETFKDAVAICRILEIRYLWIDALCIIQDSIEDWEIESASMAKIYSNSYLTIAGSLGADTSTSLFSDRWTNIQLPDLDKVRVGTSSVPISYGVHHFRVGPVIQMAHNRFAQLDNAHLHTADAPLLTRAWAFQERLLPPRTLHFHAEELVWECKTGLRCECGVIDDPELKAAELYGRQIENPTQLAHRWLKSFIAKVDERNIAHDALSSIWMDLVSEYSRLKLTYESDRLPALSGLAARFIDQPLREYVAGIWTNMLPLALAYVSQWESGDFYRTSTYEPQAPSWSWASIPLSGSNGISYDLAISQFNTPSPQFKVLRISAKVLGKNPFGWVKNGVLSVRAATVMCFVTVENDGELALSLRRRGLQRPSESDRHLLKLYPDRELTPEQVPRLLFLYLGSGLGLALQSTNRLTKPREHRRIGLARWSHSFDLWNELWEPHLRIKDVDLA